MGHVFLMTAVVTLQLTAVAVVGEADIAALAFGNMIALIADNKMGEASPVLKQDHLLLCAQGPPLSPPSAGE